MEEIIDVMVPQVTEETFEVVQLMPQEHMQNRIVEQVVDVPAPQVQESGGNGRSDPACPAGTNFRSNRRASREVVRSIPVERIPERVVEQIVDIRETQVTEKTTKSRKITQQVTTISSRTH